MTVTYTLGLDDIVAFHQHFAFSRRPELFPRSRIRVRVFQAAAIVFALALGFKFGVWGYVAGIFGWYALYALQTPVYRLLLSRSIRRLYRAPAAQSELGSRTLSLESDGILSSSETATSRYAWRSVQRVAVTPLHAFVYVATAQALIVPKAALSADQFAAVMNFLRAAAPAPALEDNA